MGFRYERARAAIRARRAAAVRGASTARCVGRHVSAFCRSGRAAANRWLSRSASPTMNEAEARS